MRVLHIYKTYFPDTVGGLEEAIRQICLSTRSFGIENTVFSLSAEGASDANREEGRVVKASKFGTFFSCDFGGLSSFRMLKELAKDTDVIHLHYPWPFGDLLLLALPKKIPVVVTYHSDILRQKLFDVFYAPLRLMLLRRAKTIVATSPNYAATSRCLSKRFVKGKVVTIPLTVSRKKHRPKQPDLLKGYFGAKSTSFVLFLGVQRYYKGLGYLVGAAGLTEVNIVIAGKKTNSNIFAKKPANLFLLDEVTEAEKEWLLCHASALVLPSHLRTEAFGVVLLEASVRGIPMITCDIETGTSYVNLHNHTGIVVPPRSPSALANAIEKLVENRELAREFGRNATRRFENKFSPDVVGKSYARLYAKQ